MSTVDQGDLKIVDRPASVTLSAGQQMTLSASIKVASTETGIIFGYVTFEKKSAADKECSAGASTDGKNCGKPRISMEFPRSLGRLASETYDFLTIRP